MSAVERFYQLAVLGLVASGYAGVALTGYLTPNPHLHGPRSARPRPADFRRGSLRASGAISRDCALACIIYYPVDYLYLSRDFLLATVHMIIFLAVLKILSARTQRDHFYALSIGFLELLASAILSTGISFLPGAGRVPLLPDRRADQRGDPACGGEASTSCPDRAHAHRASPGNTRFQRHCRIFC